MWAAAARLHLDEDDVARALHRRTAQLVELEAARRWNRTWVEDIVDDLLAAGVEANDRPAIIYPVWADFDALDPDIDKKIDSTGRPVQRGRAACRA